MSWNVSHIGHKKALVRHVDEYFNSLLTNGQLPAHQQAEYSAGKTAMKMLIEAAPEAAPEHHVPLIRVNAWGSATAASPPYPPSYSIKIEIELVSPTLNE
jgi:NAD(P)-dependent dehydrogenase (short-subunit alcohol dehydrogenase family)